MASGDSVNRLTRSVSDGSPVDWEHVEIDSNLDADTVDAMREVARIAEFNRGLQRVEESPTPTRPQLGSAGVPLQRWRDLTLLESIGAGARGEVWRAWDSTLQRQVALKFLLPAASNDNPVISGDLLNEARALARVRHPSIVTVHGIAEHEGRIGMWMECVSGVTLAREIERIGALPAREVARIGLQLCAALEALETAGLVHRDIKPANILLEGEDRVVLTDFGLGWRLDVDHDDAAARGSGTPFFMAPEVLSGEKATIQSDLYSLGVTLWWALAGEAPFDAKNFAELKRQAERGPTRPLPSIQPSVPSELVDAIQWAMNPAASKRPRSASELAARMRTAVTSLPGSTHLEPRTTSIAVLPFVNRDPGGEDEYFSDGLADELIAMLGKIRGLRVAARTSSFMFRARQATVGEIGRALNVETLLDGSMRRSGERIRIAVQLIHVEDGLHLWSENYDRTLDDVFAVQDDIARSAVKELRIALQGAGPGVSEDVQDEVARAAKGRARNPEAHRLYLVGKHLINRLSREDLTRAIQILHEAVALEPRFALAWSELGGAYLRAATWGLLPKADAVQQARDAVQQALSLEPDLAEAHARHATFQLLQEWNWKGAEASCVRALELAPGDTSALNTAGVVAMALGRTEESIRFHRRATEQDPLSVSPHANLGLTLHRVGRFAEAEVSLRRALELAPQRLLTRAILALAIAEQGRGEEALTEVAREPDEGQRLYSIAIIQHTLGNETESDAALGRLEESHGDHYAFQIAEVHAMRCDADATFGWLDRAYAQRDFGLSEIQGVAPFRPLHRDPRWSVMLLKMGFADVTSP